MTYADLRDRALNQVGCLGQIEAQTVAQIALEEAMKYVAFHLPMPSLISSATATAPASPELEANAIALTGGGGTFGIGAGVYQAPQALYVKNDSSVVEYGTPYEYVPYHEFLALKAIPAGMRIGIMTPGTIDERPQYCWTVTPNNKVWVQPLAEDNVITLFYRKAPAAYSGSASPEIYPAQYDYILVNAAVAALKEWLREPETITTFWNMFDRVLADDMKKLDTEFHGMRKRTVLKIHRSYRPR